MTFPDRWQSCESFLSALEKLKYVKRDDAGCVMTSMPDGIYLCMYELWKEGKISEREAACRWLSEVAPSAAQHPPHLAEPLARWLEDPDE